MPRIVFGAAPVGNIDAYKTATELGPVIDILKKHKANTFDSAQLYGASEATIGTISDSVKNDLVIDTKWLGGWKPGSATKSNIIDTGKSSLSKLGVPQVDIFYLHAHDPDTPLSDTLAGVNEVYKTGTFRRFGLSNFLAKTVQEVYEICKSNNYVLPTVYQVNYSPVTRIPEDELFPLLRKLGIAIYAYSPIAGGLLAKSRAQVEAGEGRFNPEGKSQMYNEMYNRPTVSLPSSPSCSCLRCLSVLVGHPLTSFTSTLTC